MTVLLRLVKGITPVLFMGMAPAIAYAQTPMTAAEAVARVLSTHPSVQASQSTALAARELVRSAGAYNAPVMKLSRTDTLNDPNRVGAKQEVGLSWAPPQWGQADLQQAVAQHNQHEAEQTTILVRQKLAADARRYHITVTWLDEWLRWGERIKELQASATRTAQRQVKLGQRTQQEWVSLSVQQQEEHLAQERVRQERNAAWQSLQTLLGMPPESPWAPRAVVREAMWNLATPAEAEQDLLRIASQTRPESLAIRARCAAVEADAQLKSMDNTRLIKDVQLNYVPAQAGKVASWGMQVDVQLPVTGPRNGHDTVFDAQRSACAAQQAQVEQQIRDEVMQARLRYDSTRQEAEQYIRLLMPLYDQAVVLAQDSRTAGKVDVQDVLSAQIRHAQARQMAVRKLMEFHLQAVSLSWAAGQADVW